MAVRWSKEQEDLLISLYKLGLSHSKIAERIGGGLTRNAVIGKSARLKLPPRLGPSSKVNRSPNAFGLKPRPGHTQKPTFKPRPAMQPATPAKAGPDLVIPPDQRVTLEGLEPHHCRWPFGDPRHADFHYCGKEKLLGLPYCEFHVRRAYGSATIASRPAATGRDEANVRVSEDA